ncbi:hypothetical protein WR25_20767 [Diploscapter pachys]|uniref:Nudix hydrolase domain-containing protein n=1 Tax=Diploscapter pachys TaxID=2018661 RepID=A0A2A2KDP2_9BILA|nr:hypothetical protein WR25_20767 [Diploscapter pachys]
MNVEETCEEVRKLLRLTKEPSQPRGDKDAGVLILLRKIGSEFEVFLCVRAMTLRKHPGEVCFPGGMMDENDIDLQQTAMREAEEEVGLRSEDCVLLGSLPSFMARFGILIHPTVAFLTRDFKPIPNPEEVSSTFWFPLRRFLDENEHVSFPIDDGYSVHSYHFTDAPHTFGVTALMCLTVSIGLCQTRPPFDVFPSITVHQMQSLSPEDVMDRIFGKASSRFKNSKL